MSEAFKGWLKKLQAAKKIKILKEFYGDQALDYAVRFILHKGEKESREFVAKWSEEQIEKCFLVVFTNEVCEPKNYDFELMFSICESGYGSCIGERWKYNKRNCERIDNL